MRFFIPIEIISLSPCFFWGPTFEEMEVVDNCNRLFWYCNEDFWWGNHKLGNQLSALCSDVLCHRSGVRKLFLWRPESNCPQLCRLAIFVRNSKLPLFQHKQDLLDLPQHLNVDWQSEHPPLVQRFRFSMLQWPEPTGLKILNKTLQKFEPCKF